MEAVSLTELRAVGDLDRTRPQLDCGSGLTQRVAGEHGDTERQEPGGLIKVRLPDEAQRGFGGLRRRRAVGRDDAEAIASRRQVRVVGHALARSRRPAFFESLEPVFEAHPLRRQQLTGGVADL